jgi:ornithine cyclodeaminase/alanine dehydrogenase-like protein (mu-crystallin family)
MLADRFTLYLNRATIESLGLGMSRIIDLVESSLVEKAHGRTQMPAKHWMEPRPTRWFGGMSCLIPAAGYASMKWQSGSSENAARGLPYLTGMLFLNRLDDGLVAAVMDSTWITQQRTAAGSAVAVRHLARPGATGFAMLGCGVQARSHLEAFAHVMPALEEVVAYDIDPRAAAAYSEHVRAAGFRCRVVDSPRAAVDAADIVVTAGPIEPTAARSIAADWLRPGMLGITLDYDCYWQAGAFGAADRLLCDDFEQIEHIRSSGYFVGCPTPDAELGQVAAGLAPGRVRDAETIVTMNMGVAVEDLVTARAVYELACERQAGVRLPL